MTILSQREQQQIAADVRLVIESSGETASVLRPTRQGTEQHDIRGISSDCSDAPTARLLRGCRASQRGE